MKPIIFTPPSVSEEVIHSQLFQVIVIVVGCAILLEWIRRNFFTTNDIFSEALNQINKGFLIIDHSNKVTFWNEWIEKKMNIPHNLEKALNLSEFPIFSQHASVLETVTKFLADPSTNTLETRTFKATLNDKSEKCFIFCGEKFFPKSSSAPWCILIFTEIKDNKEERCLTNQTPNENSEVECCTQLERLKSELLAICTHEFKTPLVSIIGYLELMHTEKLGPLSEKQKNAIQICLKNTQRLNSLFSTLLDFTKLESGKMRLELTPQRLSSMIEETVGIIQPFILSKKISLSVNVSTDLPLVFVDASMLHRVFINILDNAVKYNKDEGKITIECWEKDNLVWVKIADTGIGIPENKIKFIGEPFFQVDTTDSRKVGGIGLGLAIVKRILLEHSSSLIIESEENKGTAVKFYLKKAIRTPSGKWRALEPHEIPLV